MNCYRVQTLLSAYIDRELEIEEQRELRNHLFRCQSCETEYRSLVILKQAMGSLYAPAPPGDTVYLFKQQLAGSMSYTYERHMPFYLLRHAAMTAACFGLFFATSLWLFPKSLPANGTIAGKGSSMQNMPVSKSLPPSPTEQPLSRSVTATSRPKTDSSLNNSGKAKELPPTIHEDGNLGPTIIGIPVSH